jgi:hypothetical protein
MTGSGDKARVQMKFVDFKRKNPPNDSGSRLQAGRLEHLNRLGSLPVGAASPFTRPRNLRMARVVETHAPGVARTC